MSGSRIVFTDPRITGRGSRGGRRGGALLAVLWLVIAMTAIALALSRGVRSEVDRASLHVDSTRAYYLAQGAIEATLRRIARPNDSDRPEREFVLGRRYYQYTFSSGTVEVEIVGEDGKLDVNQARPEAIVRLLASLGISSSEAVTIGAGIVDYRARVRQGARYGLSREQASSEFFGGESTLSQGPASIQELEELLSVPGVTPDLLYGSYREDPDRGLVRVGGLAENLTTRGSNVVNANYASPEMLAAVGLNASEIEAIVEIRRVRPLRPSDPGMGLLGQAPGPIQLGLGGQGQAFTLRATAELAGGRARRTAAALVERGGASGSPDPIHIVRWYDTAF